ncbi:MAG: hypothetical protein KF805_16775 [Phycisphaeraceae bacterium]|nr:hypothetical protein [Phycisphaeraceae bacterium]
MPRRSISITRKQIIDAIVPLARELGRSPSKLDFQARTKITQRAIERHFNNWNEALAAADLPPNVIRGLTADELLDDWGTATRKLRKCATVAEYLIDGKYSRNAYLRRFNSWAGVGRAFYSRSAADLSWQDVIKVIRDHEARGTRPWLISPDRKINLEATPAASLAPSSITYGETLDFDLLRNAPVNEAGVVYLFGCLASKLGYAVEAVQAAFPDCEAKRKDADGLLRRVRIEFEFESKNFLLHKHDVAGCDVIVCWRDNWEGCPLQVVDLSVELEKLKKPAA